jgi:hypothetical protein
MGIGIMLEMLKMWLVLRYQPLKKPEHIALYVRVGVLIYRQAASRMLREQNADPRHSRNEFLDLNVMSIISSRLWGRHGQLSS